MPSQAVNVFVSYSHADASLVAPVVRLLRVNQSLVFQDTDGIPPGKKWRDEIAKALAQSNLVVVFWCHHAFRSNEVSTEWRAAIEQGKDLLPLLLDATPLPSELGNFQWIDFRGTVGASHSGLDSPADDDQRAARPRPMAASPRRGVWYILAGVGVAAAAGLSTFLVRSPLPSHAPPGVPFPPLEASDAVLISWITLLLGVVGALGAWFLWLRHRRAKRKKRLGAATPHVGEVERRIAAELETEILRRTASAHDAGA